MMALAGYPLGLDFLSLDKDARTPAAQVAPALSGGFTDPALLDELARRSEVVTFDWDNTIRRISRMWVNGNAWQFLYDADEFLVEVRPPAGPSWRYAYWMTGTQGTVDRWGTWWGAVAGTASCTLSCPSNITTGTGAGAGSCGRVVTYAQPQATGTCGTVTCVPASGSVSGTSA